MAFYTSLLNTLNYKVRILGKAELPREMSSALPYPPHAVAIEKWVFGSVSTTVANFTLLYIYIYIYKTGFLTSCGCVNTSVRVQPMDPNKMHREKARWEQQKNATSYFEQILQATPNKTTVLRPLTPHLKKFNQEKTNKTCETNGEANTSS